jgi:hypothetical protein
LNNSKENKSFLITEIFKKPIELNLLNYESLKDYVKTKIPDIKVLEYSDVQIINFFYLLGMLTNSEETNSIINTIFNKVLEFIQDENISLLAEERIDSTIEDKLMFLNYNFYLQDSISRKNSYNYKILKTNSNFKKYFKLKLDYIKK